MELNLIKFLLLTVAGWVNREQQAVIEYLREENRVLKGKLPAGRRLRFSDKERRRLAVRAKAIRRKVLREIETIVTPDTLLRLETSPAATVLAAAGVGRTRIRFWGVLLAFLTLAMRAA
jgi:hypothetical protein